MGDAVMVDDNEFFRNATLSICGSLEIEEAMSACVRVMREFLPVDRMFLQVYEPDLGADADTGDGHGGGRWKGRSSDPACRSRPAIGSGNVPQPQRKMWW